MNSSRRQHGRAGLALLSIGAVAMLGTSACSTDRGPNDLFDPSDDGAVVVDAVLIVDAPFPPIYLGRAVAPTQTFTRGGVAESGAALRLESAGQAVAIYAEAGDEPGRYEAMAPVGTVTPQTTYDLVASTEDGRVVTATTRTPPRFRVSQWLLQDETGASTLRELATVNDLGDDVYNDPRNRVPYTQGLLEARFERPDIPAFQVSVTNLDPESELVVDPEIFSEEDLADLDRFVSSPPLAGDDDFLRLPWLAIFYGGRTMIRIFALDENWYDLVRSSPELSGQEGAVAFGGNLGDAFDRPIFHVEGGIGLFGSAAVDSNAFFVLPAEE